MISSEPPRPKQYTDAGFGTPIPPPSPAVDDGDAAAVVGDPVAFGAGEADTADATDEVAGGIVPSPPLQPLNAITATVMTAARTSVANSRLAPRATQNPVHVEPTTSAQPACHLIRKATVGVKCKDSVNVRWTAVLARPAVVCSEFSPLTRPV